MKDSAPTRSSLIQTIIAEMKNGQINLPMMPKINFDLAVLMRNQTPIGKFVRRLNQDMAISAKLISVANSPKYQSRGTARTLEQAISLLGLEVTQNYVESIANRSLYAVGGKKYQQPLDELWTHASACAHASRLVAQAAGAGDPDELFSWGFFTMSKSYFS